mmetsp:Transcript_30628/g.66846  ORF Transcript_30628/g.66846 Transcript_30628/m.66846 type:complete len:543 (-) Transcript_30628:189-1817(-)|eukprot:CAMPEP_0118935106 /NCGR_PEP_ID=MMETSP1169-20130426/14922_1 /TAXON_ID=36882 /ORGANISM="Pyramimonas obovata, Strain CCMP722" /LENGTH=542 /DNA_ID=CAMNT_0006878093 /DNA_START=205 /DNA_END=1833 /DNA_ORIENTATION=+
MVVLAASIITKTGKPLLSRQFVDMSRIRIEGLLAAFPKLVGSGKQHTYVETENVRYVYQPLESLFLLLVTNKQSNILEDLETLRLLSKLVPEYCQITLNTYEHQPLDEETVQRFAFDLLFAFDEVISFGHKDNVTLQQVKTYTEMDSHEEKLHKMIIQSKINDTKDVMKKKASEIDKDKVHKAREGGKSGFPGLGSISSGGMGGMGGFATETYDSESGMGGGSMGDHHDDMGAQSYDAPMPSRSDSGSRVMAAPKKGMVLGGKSGSTNKFLDSLKAEGEMLDNEPSPARGVASAAPVISVPEESVSIAIEEKLIVTLKKDGGLESMEVQGTMALEVMNEDDAFIHIHIEAGANKGFQFKTHPNIDKGLYSRNNTLGLKDPNRPFPAGSPLGVLKWRMQTNDESMVPLSINCWPSTSGNESYVSIEYEATNAFDLAGVIISVPLPLLRDAPVVNQVDGDFMYDPRKNALEWSIDLIDDTNRSGSLEFVVPAADVDVFFPIEVSFSSKKTFCDVKVVGVTNVEGGDAVKFAYSTGMMAGGYAVV